MRALARSIITKSNYDRLIDECGLDDDKDVNSEEKFEEKSKVPKNSKNMLLLNR